MKQTIMTGQFPELKGQGSNDFYINITHIVFHMETF